MALSGGEVHEPAVGDEVEPVAVLERELLDELPRLAGVDRQLRAAPGSRSRR